MKKILTFALATAVALSFSGCIKKDNSWSEYQSVLPGMTIYQLAMNQNNIALTPANAGIRLSILVAEALSQDPESDLTNLDDVTVSQVKVLSALFNSTTEVEALVSGNYKITFDSNVQQNGSGLALSGSMKVMTNGVKSLADGGTWNVVMENMVISSSSSSSTSGSTKIFLDSGVTNITCDGAGQFTVDVSGFRSHFEGSTVYSNWTGRFMVKAPDASATYEKCAGKFFDVSGNASGPTMYTADALLSQPLTISYTLQDGLYKGFQILDGTQTCTLPNASEYSTSDFPASTVVFQWTYDESAKTPSYRVTYNGTVYPA